MDQCFPGPGNRQLPAHASHSIAVNLYKSALRFLQFSAIAEAQALV